MLFKIYLEEIFNFCPTGRIYPFITPFLSEMSTSSVNSNNEKPLTANVEPRPSTVELSVLVVVSWHWYW